MHLSRAFGLPCSQMPEAFASCRGPRGSPQVPGVCALRTVRHAGGPMPYTFPRCQRHMDMQRALGSAHVHGSAVYR